MIQITVTVPKLEDYPKLGDTHIVFREKADKAWKGLYNLAPSINTFSTQANAMREEIEAERKIIEAKAILVAEKASIVQNTTVTSGDAYNIGAIDEMMASIYLQTWELKANEVGIKIEGVN